jgi:ABC-type nitrate/sulfonate/bicarbonate transport system substrate-binding protein
MPANLRAGNLDGYSVGEPWNSLAVLTGAGWIAATSGDIDPLHPEKVLLVRRHFAETRSDEHNRMIAALLEACQFCAAPENADRIIETLARPEYLNTPASALRPSFGGSLDYGDGRSSSSNEFSIFHGHDANEPSADKAAWIVRNMQASGLCPVPLDSALALARRAFRPDLFQNALTLQSQLTYANKPSQRFDLEPAVR